MTENIFGRGAADRAFLGHQLSQRLDAAAEQPADQVPANGTAAEVITQRGMRAFRTDLTAAFTGTGSITGLPLPGSERAPFRTVKEHLLAGLAELTGGNRDNGPARPAARPLRPRPGGR